MMKAQPYPLRLSKDQEIADRVLAATQEWWRFKLPNTGILVMLPVLQAYGLNRFNPVQPQAI